ncbi:MAG: hypothetical protein Q4G34_05780 [Micrococcus sp.]|nr:hypothetical protein [Micrococcus sp.]
MQTMVKQAGRCCAVLGIGALALAGCTSAPTEPAAGGASSASSPAVSTLPTATPTMTPAFPTIALVDTSEETVLQNVIGTGRIAVTVRAEEEAQYKVAVVCTEDARDGTDRAVDIESDYSGEMGWMAGSEGCGNWTAMTPETTEAGDITFVVTVDGDEPFRLVVTERLSPIVLTPESNA